MININLKPCKKKYFIIREGEERAIIRDSERQAEKAKERLEKHSDGKAVKIYMAEHKT